MSTIEGMLEYGDTTRKASVELTKLIDLSKHVEAKRSSNKRFYSIENPFGDKLNESEQTKTEGFFTDVSEDTETEDDLEEI